MSNTPGKQEQQSASARELPELAPADYSDPVIEAYKKDVDRSLLRENLKLSVEERVRRALAFHRNLDELRRAGAESRSRVARKGET